MTSHDSDDELTLSSSTLDALKAFYADRDARAEQFAKLKAGAEEHMRQLKRGGGEKKVLSMEVFGEDWNETNLKSTCDRIICDPPFLSEDCQTKVRWLSKPSPPSDGDSQQQPRLIVCTGERMEDIVTRVYRSFGLRTTDYDPIHARGLSNEFYCYANFESDAWGWRGGR
ncbi:Protein-lysine N-methyltransferase efm5 [Collariella sp. IMI 366227]|nr:Protein-lysine N-methyltransferase efm5 [Collariella sp. IMI 366227]